MEENIEKIILSNLDTNGTAFMLNHKKAAEEITNLIKEEVLSLCHAAFFRKDVGKGLPFDYCDNAFESWKKNNINRSK